MGVVRRMRRRRRAEIRTSVSPPTPSGTGAGGERATPARRSFGRWAGRSRSGERRRLGVDIA
eukprot:4276824-Pyramimonas_sp.AAC.2